VVFSLFIDAEAIVFRAGIQSHFPDFGRRKLMRNHWAASVFSRGADLPGQLKQRSSFTAMLAGFGG
jgi:hypothetical protein